MAPDGTGAYNKVRPGTRKQSLAQASETLQVNPNQIKTNRMGSNWTAFSETESNQIESNQCNWTQFEIHRIKTDVLIAELIEKKN